MDSANPILGRVHDGLVLVMLCINVILRKQCRTRTGSPIRSRRLRFMSPTTRNRCFSHRITWLGFGIAASIAILNGFSFLYPTLPTLPIKRIAAGAGLDTYSQKSRGTPSVASVGPTTPSSSAWIVDAAGPIVLQLVFLHFLQGTIGLDECRWSVQSTGFPYIDRQCFGAAIGFSFPLSS